MLDGLFVTPSVTAITEALASASPSLGSHGTARIRLEGEIPSPLNPPPGCIFQTRCPRKLGAICEEQEPALADAGAGHAIRCHIPVDELRRHRWADALAPIVPQFYSSAAAAATLSSSLPV